MNKRRIVKAIAVAGALTVAGIGFLHTSVGRPLLARAGGCPVGGKSATPEEIEALRRKTAPKLKGSTKANARPAFGFALDTTTRADVMKWGAEKHASCTEEQGGSAVRCERLDTIEDAFFRFDPKGVLVGVDLVHAATDGATAARVADDITKSIETQAGAPTNVRGTRSGEYLSQGTYRQAAAEFRFTNYAADVTATNLGDVGVVVREQYRSIPD